MEMTGRHIHIAEEDVVSKWRETGFWGTKESVNAAKKAIQKKILNWA
jgi:hypothetical protein